MQPEAEKNMDYIQALFLKVPGFLQSTPLDAVIGFLDEEPPAFRSVAYESASMEIAWKDLSKHDALNAWRRFYAHSRQAHAFHVEIGLGWAFAKAGSSPIPHIASFSDASRTMIFDGAGYFFGLFHGRRTVMHTEVPPWVSGADLHGFDQGLGRRLWYRARGNTAALPELLRRFDPARQSHLWRGVGIACGYVGGLADPQLEELVSYAGENRPGLCAGIALAVASRSASDSITGSLEAACRVVCGTAIGDVLRITNGLFQDAGTPAQNKTNPIAGLESLFARQKVVPAP